MPASPPSANKPTFRSTPGRRPAATDVHRDGQRRPHRPAVLEQLLDQLAPGDTLVVWKLDRLGRSLRHLVDTGTGLAERGRASIHRHLRRVNASAADRAADAMNPAL
jgi:DNA invertase Pin-like site-specific DNA recombinase